MVANFSISLMVKGNMQLAVYVHAERSLSHHCSPVYYHYVFVAVQGTVLGTIIFQSKVVGKTSLMLYNPEITL